MNDASVLDAGVFPAMRHGGAEARATLPLSRRLAQLRIAAIIPLYNGGRFIREALESVLAQTLPPAEIVVVDDGSTDNGPDIVAEMAATHPISLLRKPNGGQASARNFGIAETSSELIALLDQDDAWYPDHLERLARPFLRAAEPAIGWVYGDLDEIDLAGNMVVRSCLRLAPQPHPKRDVFACLRSDMLVLPSATLIARAAFDAVGGFDERLCGFEDDDLFLRIFRAGFDNVFVGRGVTRWRIHAGSASYSSRMAVSRMIYFHKLLAEFPDEPARDRFYARQYLAPRFLPWIVHEYTTALRNDDAAGLGAALTDLAFVRRLLRIKVRMLLGVLLPLLRRPRLVRPLLPWVESARPVVRRLMR
jgi:glycosyltransferase involved in cell wall biosynthesis